MIQAVGIINNDLQLLIVPMKALQCLGSHATLHMYQSQPQEHAKNILSFLHISADNKVLSDANCGANCSLYEVQNQG